MYKNAYVSWAVALGLVVFVPAFAATSAGVANNGGGWGGGLGMRDGAMMGSRMPGVFGTVTAVNGTTLTVTQKTRPNAASSNPTASPTVYMVDASSATVMKSGANSTLSNVAVGDTVMVQGTVDGTNVTATVIHDGLGGMMGGRGMREGFGWGMASSTSSTPPITGNGEPVIAGNVASVSGTTLTVTNASNVTYTVDVSGAKIVKGGATIAVTSVATGDNVVVQGTVNGTSVTAASVIDQETGSGNRGIAGTASPLGSHTGFFGSIGSFFKRIFGF